MSLTPEQRKVLDRAKVVEAERVELAARALELRVDDLLPPNWEQLSRLPMADPVTLCIEFGVTENDAEIFTDRECRNFLRFVGHVADEQRAYLARKDEEAEADD